MSIWGEGRRGLRIKMYCFRIDRLSPPYFSTLNVLCTWDKGGLN